MFFTAHIPQSRLRCCSGSTPRGSRCSAVTGADKALRPAPGQCRGRDGRGKRHFGGMIRDVWGATARDPEPGDLRLRRARWARRVRRPRAWRRASDRAGLRFCRGICVARRRPALGLVPAALSLRGRRERPDRYCGFCSLTASASRSSCRRSRHWRWCQFHHRTPRVIFFQAEAAAQLPPRAFGPRRFFAPDASSPLLMPRNPPCCSSSYTPPQPLLVPSRASITTVT